MIIISHCANIYGEDKLTENRPYNVDQVLKMGFHCWVDVWWKNDKFYLGSDEPKYPVKSTFLNMYALWTNAKDFITYIKLNEIKSPNSIFYKNEPFLTKNSKIITNLLIDNYESSTILFTEEIEYKNRNLFGIITKNIITFSE